MPKGVEHPCFTSVRQACTFEFLPLMPKGVEHKPAFAADKPASSRVPSVDAERR